MEENKKDLKYYMDLHYPIEITKLSNDEGGGYMACIPMLGRKAFCSNGITYQVALEGLSKVKKTLFEEHIKNNIQIKEPKNQSINTLSREDVVKEIKLIILNIGFGILKNIGVEDFGGKPYTKKEVEEEIDGIISTVLNNLT